MAGKVQQRIDVGDGHLAGPRADLDNVLAGFDFAFGEYPAVEARSSVGDEQRCHLRFADAHSGAVARDARLGHLEDRFADSVPVPDAHLPLATPLVQGVHVPAPPKG